MYARFRYVSKNNVFVISIEPNNQSEVYAQVFYKVRKNQIVSVECINRSLTPSAFQFVISRFGTYNLLYLISHCGSDYGFYFDNDFQFF